MATFKVSGQLNIVFSDVEIEANSKEEALEKLYRKDCEEILDECFIEESDIAEGEAFLDCANFKFKVSDITYDIDDYSLEESGKTREEIIADLPTEMEIELLIDASDYDDVDEILADEISDRTGWCVEDFSYELSEEDDELFGDFN